jgi:uncharacterized delta-60 repeat protein
MQCITSTTEAVVVLRHRQRRCLANPLTKRRYKPHFEFLEDRQLLNAGALDSTFGNGGLVVTDFGAHQNEVASRVVIQPDNKIVVAGSDPTELIVARYLPNGSLDTSFGSQGRTTAQIGTGAHALGIALQGDKILAMGANSSAILVRYNSEGTLDTTFGTGGELTFDNFNTVTSAFAAQPDGKILVVSGAHGFDVTCFTANGAPDPTFVAGDFSASPGVAEPGAVTVQADGKIVVAGFAGSQHQASYVVVRYNPNGPLDTAFGSGGHVIGQPLSGSIDNVTGMVIQPDGEIIVTGDFGMERFTANGTFDTTFGGGRGFQTNLGIALAPEGKIIGVGQTPVLGPGGVAEDNFIITRFDANGFPDLGFGVNGSVTTDFTTRFPAQTGRDDIAHGVLVQPDGMIVVVGSTAIHPNGDRDFALARYVGLGADAAFVAKVYVDLLHRPADPAGLAFWSTVLSLGASRPAVVLGMESSIEYRALVVEDLYLRYLHRPADPQGLQYSVSFLAHAGTDQGLAQILISSPEYLFSQGGGTVKGFIDAAYRDVLQRSADPNSEALLIQALSAGASFGEVAYVLLHSPERYGQEAQNIYERYLHRPVDPGALQAIVSAMAQGVTKEMIAAFVLGAKEYAG